MPTSACKVKIPMVDRRMLRMNFENRSCYASIYLGVCSPVIKPQTAMGATSIAFFSPTSSWYASSYYFSFTLLLFNPQTLILHQPTNHVIELSSTKPFTSTLLIPYWWISLLFFLHLNIVCYTNGYKIMYIQLSTCMNKILP